MIVLHRLNGSEFVLNDNHIETIEETPDSVITLTNEKKYIVTEPAKDIINSIIKYQQKVHKKVSDID